MLPDISAVIPAYDCAATIGEVVAGCRRHVDRVWVVDDGSGDDTAEVAARAGARVERLERNRGKGAALRRGLELALAADPGGVVMLDGDGQHDPGDLPALAAAWREGAELVVGSRLGCPTGMPKRRYWTNYVGSRVLSWMTGWELEDSQSGYRLLAAPLARKLDLKADGYAVESEMLLKAARAGARLAHVQIRSIYTSDGASHFQPFLDTTRICVASIYFKVFDEP